MRKAGSAGRELSRPPPSWGAFRTQTELHYEWINVCLLHSRWGLVRGGCPARWQSKLASAESEKGVAQRLNAFFMFVFSCVTYVFSGEDAGRPGKASQAASFGTAAQMRFLRKLNCAGDGSWEGKCYAAANAPVYTGRCGQEERALCAGRRRPSIRQRPLMTSACR